MKTRTLLFITVILTMLTSCQSSKKNVLYLQDAVYNQYSPINNATEIKVQPRDELQINVSCREPQLAQMFNLQLGSTSSSGGSQRQRLSYLVNQNGYIDFPILGELKVEGLTREQVADLIKTEIEKRNLLKDPIVTVNFDNLHFTVLGEVGSPGQYAIDRDQINLFEALSMAGDLTIYGERDKVYVVRETDGQRIMHRVNLKSTDVFTSPVFYLQQNDLIVVEPNGMKAGQRTANENSLKSISMWMSILSFVTTMIVLFVK